MLLISNANNGSTYIYIYSVYIDIDTTLCIHSCFG